jgi:beta-lactamase class A
LILTLVFLLQSPVRAQVPNAHSDKDVTLGVIVDETPATIWNQKLQSRMVSISKAFDGELGLYVKDIDNGTSYSMNADTFWYLASSIKLFVLIEVLNKVEKGALNLTDAFQIQKSHYRDGSGQTNWVEPGQSVSLRFLVEQMMIESDNAATDILISLVTLDDLNKSLKLLGPAGFNPITTLLNVRHLVFSEFHPKAKELTNMDFITLKRTKEEILKTKKLAELIGIEKKELAPLSITAAYERYYEKGLNSGTLLAYAEILEKIARGQVINQARSQEIVDLMRRCYTGKDRIVAGLDKKLRFAHKTGTQHRRACDMGILSYIDKDKAKKAVVVACTQKFRSAAAANEVFRKIGEAISESGLMP